MLHAWPPQFVAYTQLVRTTKRPYMSGVTAIEVGRSEPVRAFGQCL